METIPAIFPQEQSKRKNHGPLSKANALSVLLQNSPTSSHRLGHGRTNWQNRCEIKQAIRLDAKTSMRLGHGSLDPTTMPMPMQSPAKVVPACWDDQFHAWAAYRNQTLNQSTTLISKLQAIVAILQRKNLEHPVNGRLSANFKHEASKQQRVQWPHLSVQHFQLGAQTFHQSLARSRLSH